MLIQKSYFWIPRQANTDPATGPYANFPPGGWSYVTDTPDLLPSSQWYGHLYLPEWMPRKVLINRCILAAGSSGTSGTFSEMMVWVDPGGVAYNSASGNEAGSDFTKDISIARAFYYDAFPIRDVILKYPILWDRDVGDKLVIEIANSFYHDWVSCELGFLVPAA